MSLRIGQRGESRVEHADWPVYVEVEFYASPYCAGVALKCVDTGCVNFESADGTIGSYKVATL